MNGMECKKKIVEKKSVDINVMRVEKFTENHNVFVAKQIIFSF